jgi:signal transduction histidine kinase
MTATATHQAPPESAPSREKAKLILAIALLLLGLSGLGAAITIIRLYLSEGWVRHTYAVEVALGDLESALAGAGTSRVAYVDSPTAQNLQNFRDAARQVPPKVATIRSLTGDNPSAGPLCDRLQQAVDHRLDLSLRSVALVQQHQSDSTKQMQLTTEVGAAAGATAAIEQEMRSSEDRLLDQRARVTRLLFGVTVAILIVSFILSAVMFLIHNRMLQGELHQREDAEQRLRQLSIQLLRVRDDEARRFARELHDGLGQTLVAAKMTAEALAAQNPSNSKFIELAKMVQDAASQTRTISYLLHPPMLDELGFASAAEWFIEGFTQRTGIAVTKSFSPGADHLPKDLELALFRILQEALTNIHRHSKSSRAEVSVLVQSREVILAVSDQGVGISAKTLENFQTKGTHVGVGLAGMKERVTELKGELKIQSNGTGTKILVKMPIQSRPELSTPSLA